MRNLLPCVLALVLFAVAAPSAAHQQVDPELLKRVEPRRGAPPADIRRPPGDPLVEKGRRLFFEETFGGNGRTCGTCHRAERNFTIDPEFIAKLPPTDPLFVHETNPALAALENAELLRKHALFLENLDGFDRPGVFRSAQHIFGLRLTTGPARGGNIENPLPDAEAPLQGALGWSGDGAPGTGTLLEFAVGAVVQHMPKTLNRVEGVDFRLPTEDELDALEAFQLSLGRQEEYIVDPADPNALTFRDPFVSEGQRLFHDAPARTDANRSCGACHHNAGSNQPDGFGANRNTGTQRHPNAPACRAPGQAPFDNGFGATPETTVTLCGQTLRAFGDGRFNSQSLVEAADTPPFFHNNIVDTIEEAVDFYTTDIFSVDRAFVLSKTQINQVAAFLRAINAIDNIASAQRSLNVGVGRPSLPATHKSDALRDIKDAINVLTKGPTSLFASTRAVDSLRAAITKVERGLITPARVDLARAQQLIVGPPPRGGGAQAARPGAQ